MCFFYVAQSGNKQTRIIGQNIALLMYNFLEIKKFLSIIFTKIT